MKKIRVNSFNELHDALQKYSGSAKWIFRGQCNNPSWTLIPKAGRRKFRIEDENLFRAWKRHAFAYESRNFESDWEWLTIAQHHGLPTRLLDWTRNPLAATFFAIENTQSYKSEYDAVVFSYFDDSALGTGKRDKPLRKPFSEKDKYQKLVIKFAPRSVTQRLVMQQGLFTYHNPPNNPLEMTNKDDRKLEKIIIPRAILTDLKKILSYYGINKRTLFPDFDGLSNYLSWFYDKEYDSNLF